MTKVKMLTRFATPFLMAAPGQVIDVLDSVADSLVACGYATLVTRIREPVVETASLDESTETAAKSKPVKKKR